MAGREGPRRRVVAAVREVVDVDDKEEEKSDPGESIPQDLDEDVSLSWIMAFVVLLASRWLSTKVNIIHDCDETFNYWEPLHYLMHGYGLQTWEYSSEFGLRSYLYLLLHAVFSWPASLWYGDGPGKVYTFIMIRGLLGAASAASEAALCAAVSRKFGGRIGSYTLLLLFASSGCFTASTTFLPSTFSMYAVTLAVAAYISGRPRTSVAVGATGVLLGWPFSALALAPIVVHALFSTRDFWGVLTSGVAASVATLAASICADRYFYGRWTCSVWNLVHYNVAGGGDSALYGVEGPLFYLRNLANNFNLALPLALALPPLLAWIRREHRRPVGALLLAVSPLYLWLGFMSLQPHKEERFLYVVYPLICLAAASTIALLPNAIPYALRGPPTVPSTIEKVAMLARPAMLAVILGLSYCRTMALLHHYSAPMQILQSLPHNNRDLDSGFATVVCFGSEWHRFPSSFFLPSRNHRAVFLDDGFRGLLPFPFDDSAGGTAAAPPYFNKENKYSPQQFVKDEGECDYLVEVDFGREGQTLRGSDPVWEVVDELLFLDSDRSPALSRAFHIPGWSDKYNVYGAYKLSRRKARNDSA